MRNAAFANNGAARRSAVAVSKVPEYSVVSCRMRSAVPVGESISVSSHRSQVRFGDSIDAALGLRFALEMGVLICPLLRCATSATMLPMNRVITQRELRNQSAAVLREVEAGRTFVLTRNGTPVAELRPIRPRQFVPRATIADAGAHAPRVDARQFRADLDSVIDQRIDD